MEQESPKQPNKIDKMRQERMEALRDYAIKDYERLKGQIESIAKPQMEALAKITKTMEDYGVFKTFKSVNEQMKPVIELFKQEQIRHTSLIDAFPTGKQTVYYAPPIKEYHHLTDDEIEAIAEKTYQKIQKKPKLDINIIVSLPEKSAWENIEIQFSDTFSVKIYFNGKFVKEADYKELGFSRKNTKDELPNKQWEFLNMLGVIYANSNIAKATIDNLMQTLKINKETCMKIKENLSRKLQEIFGIKSDPFYNYREIGEYKTKFKLKPIAELRGNGEIYPHHSEYNDNLDYST